MPEPGTLALLLVAALALVKYARPTTKVNHVTTKGIRAKRFSPMRMLGLILPLLMAGGSSAQSIPSVSVSPTSATAGAATTVTATVAITDARLTSVNLIKIDSTGRSTNLGPMHDDGLNGDVSSNDRTFTLRFTVLEASPTTISYKASAVLRGVLSRVMSAGIPFIVFASPIVSSSTLSARGFQTCALTSTGGVKCWGFIPFSPSGNDDDVLFGITTTPRNIIGLPSGIAAVAAGGFHACALTTGGGVKCWGENADLQLGNWDPALGQLDLFDQSAKSIPQSVTGLASGVHAISLGGRHSCALTSAAGVKCWGANDRQQLGSFNSTGTPQDVVGLTSGVAMISAGSDFTCAVTATGVVKCWGDNSGGQLGAAPSPIPQSPQIIVGLSGTVIAVSAGSDHACALTSIGGVKCWGGNFFGQLGNGTTNISPVVSPQDVVGLTSGVVEIAAGVWHTCARTIATSMKCWGNNDRGALGNGISFPFDLTNKTTPQNVTGLTSGVTAISAALHTCARTFTGNLKCWGENNLGHLGNGQRSDFYGAPTPIPQNVVGF